MNFHTWLEVPEINAPLTPTMSRGSGHEAGDKLTSCFAVIPILLWLCDVPQRRVWGQHLMQGQVAGMPGEQLSPAALTNNPDTGPAPGTCTRNKQLKYKTPSDGISVYLFIFNEAACAGEWIQWQ